MIKILSTGKQIKKNLGIEPLQAASIRVTMACNLKCKQCYALAGNRLENEMSLEEIKKIIDDLKKLGAMRIFFTGGEPFARHDILEILKYADENNFAMYISTNGTFINPNIIQKLKSLKHLRTFQISIDGLEKLHDSIRGVGGTFKKAIETIKIAVRELKNTKIAIISTLMKDNLEETEKIFKLALRLNVDTFGIVDLYPVKRSVEAEEVSALQKNKIFKKLSEIYKKEKPKKLRLGLLIPPAIIPQSLKEIEYGCGYVCSFPSLLGIGANGDVAPCDGLLNFKSFILGNIRKNSLKDMWNHSIMKKLRNIEKTDLGGVCKKCKHLDFCMGGCRARAFIEYGNFKAPSPLCQSFYDKNLFPKKMLVAPKSL